MEWNSINLLLESEGDTCFVGCKWPAIHCLLPVASLPLSLRVISLSRLGMVISRWKEDISIGF